MKVKVILPPDYPENDPNFPSKRVLEQAFNYMIPIAKRLIQQRKELALDGQQGKTRREGH